MGRGLTIEDCEVGKAYKTAGRTIGESDIMHFAGLVGDFSPMHTDAEYAKTMPYGGRVAHGPLTSSCAIGQFMQLGVFDGTLVAVLAFDFDLKAVVRIGDTIHAHVTIAEARTTSRKTTGVVKLIFDLRNQVEECVQRGAVTLLIKSRAYA